MTKFPSLPESDLGETNKSLVYRKEFRPEDFVRTKNEHAADFKVNIVASGDAANGNLTLYSVPKGRVFYLTSFLLTAWHEDLNQGWANITADNFKSLIAQINFPVGSVTPTHDSIALAYIKPLKFTEGQIFNLHSHNANQRATAVITGYEE